MNRSHTIQKTNGRQTLAKRRKHHRKEISRRSLLLEQLESRRLLAVDFGDAPDTSAGVAAGDYQTIFDNNGPSHTIVPGLHLGQYVDGDSRNTQGSGARHDDFSDVIANLTADFQAGVQTTAPIAGDSFSPNATGSGSWQYLYSESIDPNDGNANLQGLVWDAVMHGVEDPAFSHNDGSNGFYIGFPSGDELAFQPRSSGANRRPVARWIAGPTDAGEIAIQGSVRKSNVTPSDGIRFLVYVDGVSVFDQTIAGDDGRGVYFTLPEISVIEGTTVDLLVDHNGRADFDATRISAVFTRGDDEDGLVDGNLNDLDLLPGRQPQIDLVVSNETADEALLAGWIDYNRDGIFDNTTERATISVPASTASSVVTLVFPEPPKETAYATYARFRLSSDPQFLADPQPLGMLNSGEVEDYVVGRSSFLWDGDAGDNDVFNALNWSVEDADGMINSAGRPPRWTENVVIPNDFFGQTLSIDTSGNDQFRVRSIRSAAAIEITDKGFFEINEDSQIAGLTLDGTRPRTGDSLRALGSRKRLIVDEDLIWNEAQIARLDIEVNGNVLIATDRPHQLNRSVLRVHGDNSVWSGGDVQASGSSIYNHGTFTTTSNSASLRPGPFNPGATFVNASGAIWIHDAPLVQGDEKDLHGGFYNQGTLEVRSGKLAIGDCCTRLTHSGAFLVRGDAELTLRSVFTLNPNSSVQVESDGTLVIERSNNIVDTPMDIDGTLIVEGSVTINEALTLPHLIMAGSNITTGQPLIVTDEFEFLSGTLAGRTFTSQGTLTVGETVGSPGVTLRTLLVNKGHGDWLGGNIGFGAQGIQNDGTFVDSSDGQMLIAVFADGMVENNGTWTVTDDVGSGNRAQRLARFINHGDFSLGSSNINFYQFHQEDGALRLSDASMEVSGQELRINGGTLQGSGQIVADVNQTNGTIRPGNSPGILTIDGDYTASGGELEIEIAGSPTDEMGQDAAGINFDRIVVAGDAEVAQLRVELLGDYQPELSSRYMVLQASGVTGPTNNNADDVGMTIPGSDSVIELVVTSAGNTNPIADAGGPYTANEGGDVMFDASSSSDNEQASEELLYEWDFDYDGSVFDVDATGREITQSFPNQFGARDVAVRVTDAEGAIDVATTTLQIQNVAPALAKTDPGVPTISIDGNNVATLTGTFTDPGVNDPHSLEVNWGDGLFDRYELVTGDRMFQVTHVYPNNNTGASRDFSVQVRVYDETEDSDGVSFTLTQPFVNQPPVASAGGPYSGLEGSEIIFDATTSMDPNEASEDLIYQWDLDYDGTTFDVDVTGRTVPITYGNNSSEPIEIAVRVTDSQGESDIAATTVTINNVPPELDGLPGVPRLGVQIDENYLATLVGQFVDPGGDTQTVSIDWGDGSAVEELSLSASERQFSMTHPYAVPDAITSYLIGVTVTDQDGASDFAEIELLVNQPLGTLRGEKFEDQNGNAIRDPEEPALAGWEIELVDEITGDVVQTTFTDGDGNYEFGDVPRGRYQVREVQQPGWRQTFPIGSIQRINLDQTGQQAGGPSDHPAVSATGRYIAFSSLASNLVPGDTNQQRDIFVKDTVTGEIQRVSISVTGDQADGPSFAPTISADGNVIAFRSLAENLVQDDRNVASDIFVHDRRIGVTRRVSVNLDQDEGNEDSFSPSISGDGRYVAFESTASNLVPGDTNRVADVFVTDLFTGLTERVSVSSEGTQADRASFQPNISGDGRYVVFTSASQTFEDRDREVDLDVYVYDRLRDQLTLISKNRDGQAGNGDSYDPFISADGSTVAFASSATNLFPGDSQHETDIFVFETARGRVQQITYGNASSVRPSLNEDGTLILFKSQASDLVVGDENEGPDVFLYDRELVAMQRYGQVVEEVSHFVIHSSLSADGSTIGFSSDSGLLVTEDTNSARDVFVQSKVGIHRVEVVGIETIDDLDFGNEFRLTSIQGQKFEDLNGNGVRDTDPTTGAFVEPGLNGWTIRLVDSRTGEVWETETGEIDLNADGRIDPLLERGVYRFTPLPPGEYDVYEVLQDGAFPTFPRMTVSLPPIFRAPETSEPVVPSGPDPRLAIEIPNTGRFSDPVPPVTRIEAVFDGAPEQLPILYVKGFNDDGVSWKDTGQYFTTLADITGGQTPIESSANIQTYGVQFWAGDDGDPFAGAAPGDPNDNAVAVLKSLEELADPAQSYHKPSGTEFIADSIGSIVGNLFDLEQWVPVCTNFPDLSSCSIPALTFDFQSARSDYNRNGLAEYHADDLFDLLSESLGQPGKLEDFSQVNFITHSAGGLDTRAFLSLLDDSSSQSIRQSVANVIYTAPPFGGSTLAELAIPFFENDTLLSTLQDPWTMEVLSDALLGPLETLIQAFIAEPIVSTLNLASDQFEGGFTTLAERTALLPTPDEIRQTITQTVDEFDTLIKSATAGLPGGSFGIAELNDVFTTALQTFSEPLRAPVIDGVVLPLIKQALTTFVGLPGIPKVKDDLRPYEAIHSNVDRFAPNTEVPQFVVWGEGGFLRYLSQMAGGDPPVPTPVNLGPPLQLAASDPDSLHAYGDANRNGLDFSNLDLQPGDGNLSRTSALFMTDLAGGYMTALAGFHRHTHGSITTDPFGTEDNIQGSFLDGDDDNTASIGEVLVETFLTPVTALEISQPTIVVNPDARLYRTGPNAELSFAPEDRQFMDLASRVFHVTADAVEYRLDRVGSEPTEWREINHRTFQRSVSDITATLGLGDQERFTIEWRSINQQGGREAIRSATFIIDSSAPGLDFVEVVDGESPLDDSQIALPPRTPLQNLLQSDRLTTRFDVGTIERLQATDALDYIVSLDRDKTIRLQFDSPVEVEYQWNDPDFGAPRRTSQGNLSQGIAEFSIRERVPFSVQNPGFGVDYLRPGVHNLYYQAEDPSGNVSEIQSLTILIDHDAPTLIFSEADGQLVGPDAPLTLFASDPGAGVQQAFIDVPGVGSIRDTSTFTLGETDLHEQIASGDEVTLVATGIDRVANAVTETYTLRYDYQAPRIELLDVTDSAILFDDRVVTTVPEVRVTVEASDDTAGLNLDSLIWSVGGFTSGLLATGSFQQNSDGTFHADIPLAEGRNDFQVQVTDLVGNTGTYLNAILRAPGHSVTTQRGDRLEEVDFGNTVIPFIEGRKFEDLNRNGVYEPGEPLIEGVLIYIDLDDDGVIDVGEPRRVTNERGAYRFDNLLPGNFVVREIVPPGWEQVAPVGGAHVVSLGFGPSPGFLDFANARLDTALSGSVYEDLDGDGNRDFGEPGLAGMKVGLDIGSNGIVDLVQDTDPAGNYVFGNLDPGTHEVVFLGEDGFDSSGPDQATISLQASEVVEGVSFGVYRPIPVSGAVFGDLNANGMREFFEQNLVDWKLRVDLGKDGSFNLVATSDESGFQLDGLPPGTHVIGVVPQDGFETTVPIDPSGYILELQSGDTVSGLLFGVLDKSEDKLEAATVSGVVFDDLNGNGQRNSNETLRSDREVRLFDSSSQQMLSMTKTDGDGHYSFVVPADMEYFLETDIPSGFELTTADGDVIAFRALSGEVLQGLDFGLFGEARISGRVFEDVNGNGVFDEGEKAAEGASVSLVRVDQSANDQSVVTGEDGMYEFLVPPDGEYSVTSDPPSDSVVSMPDGNRYVVNTKDQVVYENIDFGHFDGMRIAGQVFNDDNGNSLQDPGEPGLIDQQVRLVNLTSGATVQVQTTAPRDLNGDGVIDDPTEAGAFDFVVQPDDYVVEILPRDNFPPTTDTSFSLTVDDRITTDLAFGVRGVTTLEGTVFDDTNGDGTRDSGEPALDGIEIQLLNERNQLLGSTTTDAGGGYTLVAPAEREVTLVAILPAGSILTSPTRILGYTLTTVVGETVGDLDFGSFQRIGLSGSVFDDVNENRSFDSGEDSLAGWTVLLDLDSDGSFDRTTTTDASGAYQFTSVGPGTHQIRQSRPSGWTRTTPVIGIHSIDARSGEDVTALDFGNRFTLGTLTGQVYRDANRDGSFDQGDTGLDGWTVEVIDPSDQSVVTTVISESVDLNGDGEISVEEVGRYSVVVPPGTYEIRQNIRSHWAQQAPYQREVISQFETNTDWFPEGHPGRAARSVAFSRDGRFVAWGHSRGNSLPGIENRKPRIFIHDRINGATEEIDLSELPGFNDPETEFFNTSSPGPSLNLNSRRLRMSGDGRYVYVRASLPVSMLGEVPSAYIYDRLENKFEAIGGGVVGIDGQGDTLLSLDGLTDRATGVTRELWDSFSSQTSARSAALSWDGNHAAYVQYVSDPNDTSLRQRQLFLFDDTTDQHHQLTDFPSAERGVEVIFGSVAIDDLGETVVATVGFPTNGDPGSSDYSYDLFIFDRTTGRSERFNYGSGGGVSITGDGRYVFYAGLRYDRFTQQATRSAPGVISRDGEVYFGNSENATGSSVTYSQADYEHVVEVAAGEIIDDADFANFNFRPVMDPIDDITILEDTLSWPVPLTGIFDVVGQDSSVTVTAITSSMLTENTVQLDFVIEPPMGEESSPVLYVTPRADDWGFNEVRFDVTNAEGVSTRYTFDVAVTAVNDAPTLNSSLAFQFPDIEPGQITNGILVSDLISNAFDPPEPPPIIDSDNGVRGIAVTDVDSSAGVWQFSTDDGNSWQDFPTGVQIAGTILLAIDNLTRIRLLPNNGFLGMSEFSFRAWDRTVGSNGGAIATPFQQQTGGSSAFSIEQATATIEVLFIDTDEDGISDSAEDAAPNDGDGNDDGVPDREQSHVASLPNAIDGTYVTIVAAQETRLLEVSAESVPEIDDVPSGIALPFGLLHYEIHDVPIGGTVDVELIFDSNLFPQGYLKYGASPDNPELHYYAFTNGIDYGVQRLARGEVTLRFTDGLTGDDDLTANGIVVDPGGPSIVVSRPVRNPIRATDVNNDGTTTTLDALNVMNHLLRVSSRPSNEVPEEEQTMFLDVNGDTNVSPLDALVVINELARRGPLMPEPELVTRAMSDSLRSGFWLTDDEEFDETIELLANEPLR